MTTKARRHTTSRTRVEFCIRTPRGVEAFHEILPLSAAEFTRRMAKGRTKYHSIEEKSLYRCLDINRDI